MITPCSFKSSSSVTFPLPLFETLKVTAPAGMVTLAGAQPASLSVTATALPPPSEPDPEPALELDPQAAETTTRQARAELVRARGGFM